MGIMISSAGFDGVVPGALTVGGQILAAAGTTSAPGIAFTTALTTGLVLNPTGGASRMGLIIDTNTALYLDGSNKALRVPANYLIGWSSASDNAVSSFDLVLARGAAAILDQRNGVNAQTFRLYGTYTDVSNYERLALSAAAGGPFAITSAAAGTGTVRNLKLDPGTADLQWGKALVALGGGAAPTLGTIGGSGPAAAAQNTWLRMLDSAGVACWVPVWK